MSDKYKGKVGVSVNNGSLRLRLPRGVFGGKQKFISLGLKDTPQNRRIAKAKAQQIESDILFNNFDQSLKRYQSGSAGIGKITLIELYQHFIESKRHLVRPGTFKNGYKVMLNHLKRSPYNQSSLEDKSLPQDLAAWASETLTIDTARRFLQQINAAINWGIERNLIDLERSPFENFLKRTGLRKSHRSEREIDPFTLEQRNNIIEHYRCHPKYAHYHLFVSFCFYTGCRTSEAIALELKNISADLQRITFSQAVVDAEGGRQRVTGLKTQDRRTVYCSTQVKAVLATAIERTPNQIIFPGIQGGLLGMKSFRKSWATILEELEIDYRKPYQMRHTFITIALEVGIGVKDIAKMVGNSPEIIYRHYAENVNRATLPDL